MPRAIEHGILKDHLGKLSVGERVRLSHTTCPAGKDTRNRLYVTRGRPRANSSTSELILAYCHNCGGTGVLSAKLSPYRSHQKARNKANLYDCEPVELASPTPTVDLLPLEEAPTHAKAWLWASGLDLDVLSDYGLAWDRNSQRVYIPSVKPAVGQIGYQLRGFGDGAPKYLTYKELGVDTLSTPVYRKWSTGKTMNDSCVVTEDKLSALCVVEACGDKWDACPLHGVHITPTVARELVDSYKRIYVWLDNDNPTVVDASNKITSLLKFLGCEDVLRIPHLAQPKENSPEAIGVLLSVLEE